MARSLLIISIAFLFSCQSSNHSSDKAVKDFFAQLDDSSFVKANFLLIDSVQNESWKNIFTSYAAADSSLSGNDIDFMAGQMNKSEKSTWTNETFDSASIISQKYIDSLERGVYLREPILRNRPPPSRGCAPLARLDRRAADREVSEALLLHPAFTGGKEVARGRFHVTYNGTQGFNVKEGNINQEGQGNAEGSIVDHFSLAPIAPVGFVAAVSMPRIELKLGTDTVFQVVKRYAPPGLADGLLNALKKTPFGNLIQQQVADKLKTTAAAYAQVIISTSTIAAGAGSLVPCQRAQLITTISVGANATVLGKEKGKLSKDIFRQEKYITVPPLKACET